METAKPIQILSLNPKTIVILCEDGSLWTSCLKWVGPLDGGREEWSEWLQLPCIK